MRRRLWAEHPGGAARDLGPLHEDRFLETWRRVAKGNVAAMNAGQTSSSPILPYARSKGAKGDARALKEVGVRLDGVQLLE